MDDPLSLSTYQVQREFGLGLMKLDFKDQNGNLLMKAHASIMSGTEIQTPDGRVLGSITHKHMAMTATYELHQSDNKSPIVGEVKVKMELMSSLGTMQEIDIKDASGNVIAIASGNFLGMEFDIKEANGAMIAKASRNMQGGILQKLGEYGTGSYNVNILNKKALSTITLLEFIVVLETLQASGHSSSPGFIGGSGTGFRIG